jgi:hypothetical protein
MKIGAMLLERPFSNALASPAMGPVEVNRAQRYDDLPTAK